MRAGPVVPGRFDTIVVVDWSANSKPKLGRDSIWIARLDVDDDRMSTTNVATRRAATAALVDLCTARARPGSRVLIGVDFSLGYPHGTAAALGLIGTPWRAIWDLLTELIVDDDDNSNNRFAVARKLNRRMGGGAGPFWGCPENRANADLTPTKVPCAPLGEWRSVEQALRAEGRRPFSAWQLMGAGSVGSQSLLGIAVLSGFVDQLHQRGLGVDVWPFTAIEPRADVVLAEVWPSLLDRAELAAAELATAELAAAELTAVGLDADSDRASDPAMVRDEAQVRAMARRLAGALDADPTGAAMFALPPAALSNPNVRAEEGWVLRP